MKNLSTKLLKFFTCGAGVKTLIAAAAVQSGLANSSKLLSLAKPLEK
jgi:hypothetical protein